MASKIEVICLDSEDEDYSHPENQKDPTPEDWCPKIENVCSVATIASSTSCDDEIIHQDDYLYQSINNDPRFNLSTCHRNGSLHQEDNLCQTIPGSSLSTPSTSPHDASVLQESSSPSTHSTSPHDESVLQESSSPSTPATSTHDDQASNPSTSRCDESVHLDNSLTNCNPQIGSRSEMICREGSLSHQEDTGYEFVSDNEDGNLDQPIPSHQEDNGDESISDNEDGNPDQSFPDNPLVNCNVQDFSTSMSDSEASFPDTSRWSVMGEVNREPSDTHLHSARIKRKGVDGSQSIQDVRTVFIRQTDRHGRANDRWDGVGHEDRVNISIASDDLNDDREEMRPPSKIPARKGTLLMQDLASGEDIVNKLENDLEDFSKEMKKMKKAEIDNDDNEEMRPLEKFPSHKHKVLKVRKGCLEKEDHTFDENIGTDGAEIGRIYGDNIRPLEKLPSQKGLKVRKASYGMEDHTLDFNNVSELEKELEKYERMIHNLDEAEIDWDDDKNSTYIKSSKYKAKWIEIYEKLAQAKKISVDLGRISDKEFQFRESAFPLVNKKLEEFINDKKIFPNFKEVFTLLKDLDANENLFKSKKQLREEAEKVFKLVGEKLKSRRMADEEDVMSTYLLRYDGSQSDDPADGDSRLEQKLQNNLKEASRYIKDEGGYVEEKRVDEESESECSLDAEESYCGDNTSDREDSEDVEEDGYSMDNMSYEADEDIEYGSPSRAKMNECVTPRKGVEEDDDSMDSIYYEDDDVEYGSPSKAKMKECVTPRKDVEEDDYSMDSMYYEENEDVEYGSPSKANVKECVTPRKDNSIAEGTTDSLESLTPIDELLKSSDDEEESVSVDSDPKKTLEIPKIVSSNLKVDSSMEDDDKEGESEVENVHNNDAMDKSEEHDSYFDEIIILD